MRIYRNNKTVPLRDRAALRGCGAGGSRDAHTHTDHCVRVVTKCQKLKRRIQQQTRLASERYPQPPFHYPAPARRPGVVDESTPRSTIREVTKVIRCWVGPGACPLPRGLYHAADPCQRSGPAPRWPRLSTGPAQLARYVILGNTCCSQFDSNA